jgi:hypothetical protein
MKSSYVKLEHYNEMYASPKPAVKPRDNPGDYNKCHYDSDCRRSYRCTNGRCVLDFNKIRQVYK